MKNETPTLLYQNQDLLIINKPAGLLSIPDGYNPQIPHLRRVLEPIYGNLWMVHRLDKETSGIMVIARNSNAHRFLNAAFKKRAIEKVYHCLVSPAPDWRKLDIQLPLKVNADRRHRTRVDEKKGKPARSICEVKKTFNNGALLEINILTGITHQIRAHLRGFNLAILGDTLYSTGLPSQPVEVPRMMLHARSLSFPDPATGEILKFSANYPDDFRQAYRMLKLPTNLDEGF
ncbi:MAG: RluA family pseudouridine synthase [Chloroflexota bacterium]|nr:RluA family pseudouridine synthase [Chloroflexota bacterium]